MGASVKGYKILYFIKKKLLNWLSRGSRNNVFVDAIKLACSVRLHMILANVRDIQFKMFNSIQDKGFQFNSINYSDSKVHLPVNGISKYA